MGFLLDQKLTKRKTTTQILSHLTAGQDVPAVFAELRPLSASAVVELRRFFDGSEWEYKDLWRGFIQNNSIFQRLDDFTLPLVSQRERAVNLLRYASHSGLLRAEEAKGILKIQGDK